MCALAWYIYKIGHNYIKIEHNTKDMIEQLDNIVIPDSIPERRVLIEDKLNFYANHEVFCPAINSNVKILSKSIDETANWGCTSVVGTKLCLLIEYVIKMQRCCV